MNSNDQLILIDKLKKAKVFNYKAVLAKDERILSLLIKFDNNFTKALNIVAEELNPKICIAKLRLFYELQKNKKIHPKIDYSKYDLEMLKSLNEADHKKIVYLETLFNSSLVNQNKQYLEKAKEIINKKTNYYNTYYSVIVLCDPDAIEAGIALKGAKIINKSHSIFNAFYASKILCDQQAISCGLALRLAKKFNEFSTFELAKQYYEFVMDKLYPKQEKNKDSSRNKN